MSFATPRGRVGGFPDTPNANLRKRVPAASPTPPHDHARPKSSLRPVPENAAAADAGNQPMIPLAIIDAPTQRFYAFAIYVALFAWRLYDYVQVQDNEAHTSYFFKWAFIDAAYLFSLPHLRIPWLELSSEFVLGAFALTVFGDWLLMFNIPMPFQGWLLAVLKIFYDKELAISEHNVKLSSILHNSSLIMGKQIINILPEGSALLNPERQPYCLSPDHPIANVPLLFNATVPIDIEFVRFDLETNAQEIVRLGRRDIREIGKQSTASMEDGIVTAYRYDVALKKPGAYRLHKVLDEYKLEVQRISPPTYIVPCPKARVRSAESSTRCLGDLSDLSLEVEGTPPLKIYYSRTINGKDHSFHFQSLQPEGFTFPLLNSQSSSSLMLSPDADFTWARPQKVPVGLNESMNNAGEWQYSVDQVHDAFGNQVSYDISDDLEPKPKRKDLHQNFVVRERPRAAITGCDLRHPLKIAKGESTKLPITIGHPGKPQESVSHTVTWYFSPIDTLSKSGDHGDVVEVGSFTTKNLNDQPTISAPGLYTLKSVSCDACDGEIEEPSACLLLNPLEPTLSIQSTEIPDNCAGNPIGLRLDLDLVGTPPFTVFYDVIKGKQTRTEHVKIPNLRHQLQLIPRQPDHYEYRFRKLQDAVYDVKLPLTNEYHLEQNVRPSAKAFFRDGMDRTACLDEKLSVGVELHGDGPFNLEWELVHDGKRKSVKETGLDDDSFYIKTPRLSAGGDYALALKSIQDRSGCKVFLEEEVKISVRHQKPRAAFGLLENKRSATVVEADQFNLPIKLSGESPWFVKYRILNSTSGVQIREAHSANDFIEATEPGIYEIIHVQDMKCHGSVDPKAKRFELKWFPRPELSLVPADSIQPTDQEHKFVKKDICEGDVDGFEVALRGSPPYHVQYDVRSKPKTGSVSVARKEFDVVLGKASIQMDTAKAGVYSYTFSALSDNLYNNDKKQMIPLTLEQTVNPKPSASFVKPGQTFKSCMADEIEHPIPVKLEGKAPFYLELEIKHQSGNYPEIYRIPNIQTNSYDIRIPRQYLKLGAQQLRIRKVRDDRGCQFETDVSGPMVQFQLYDSPTIYPLEQRTEYCVGERIGYILSGTPPFEINYEFGGKNMRAKSQTTSFRRVAESPGEFTITSIRDRASECRATVNLSRSIHPMPAVRISKGRVVQVDIHEGSEVEILFDFEGTPPFEFTYTRSTNARKGQKSQVIETRHEVSEGYSKVIMASLEGTYQVVAIKDKYCAYSTAYPTGKDKGQQKLAY
ncbi:putative nuclear pore protein [Rosellinia necatrix]|uniref:Putative nuclear pore protein n=1 Tax=Rosellinia necatrix TaxID=77044 RepID=A0A1W2TNC2_ROSNE|nr:putative nuclear pore protein [Rosellinia necatrix]